MILTIYHNMKYVFPYVVPLLYIISDKTLHICKPKTLIATFFFFFLLNVAWKH